MRISKFLLRSLLRIFCKSSIRRLFGAIIFIIFLSFFLLFFYTKLVYYFNYCCSDSENVIVSLTTTPKRFHYELPFTIHSLLTQTVLPKEIRIYLSPTKSIINQKNLTLDNLKLSIRKIDSSIIIRKLFDKLVRIQFEDEDFGPATKFLPIIKEFHGLKSSISKSQAILVCDDDHYYHPFTVSALVKYSNIHKNSIIGLRGWRIRDDLVWGVSSAEEVAYHIIYSFRLSEIYRVGIVTANHGYIIRPSFFDSHVYLDFNQTSPDVGRVDDIWLNGHASKRNITRFVIPTCCSSISVTRTHELENYFIANGITRSAANDHALKWFGQAWERDISYKFKGENQPKHQYWWTKIYRYWISIILRLKFVIYVGFV